MPADALRKKLEGFVTDSQGTPMADTEVDFHQALGSVGGRAQLGGDKSATTNARGHFVLSNVPRHSGTLFVMGPRVSPMQIDLANHVHQNIVRVTVSENSRFRLPADTFKLSLY